MIKASDKERYSRQITLSEVGLSGQKKMFSTSVLVIGAGGLGCPTLLYLVAAGVRNLGIVDFDTIERSNLPRQVIFNESDVGELKAEIARKKILKNESIAKIIAFNVKLDQANAAGILADYDLVIDCTDNFGTRYLINDTCVKLNKCWVYGSVHLHQGQVSVFNWNGGPTYRDLFPESSDKETAPNCNELGVLGAFTGIIGTHMAMEAMKVILEIGTPLSGKIWVYNSLNNQSDVIAFSHGKSNTKVKKPTKKFNLHEINVQEFATFIHSNKAQIVDIRNNWELPQIDNIKHLSIPLELLEERIAELKKFKSIIFICQKGIRSKKAVEIAETNNLINTMSLAGGIEKYLEHEKEQST